MANENNVENADDRQTLLEPEEREACRLIAAGNPPHSQRALALMALDQGVAQTEAGELSGLTIGQVRYWRGRFRQDRLGIFPEELLAGANASGAEKRAAKQGFEPDGATSPKADSAEERKDRPEKKETGGKANKAKAAKSTPSRKRKQRTKKGKKKDAKGKAKSKKDKARKGKLAAEAGKRPKKNRASR